MYNIKPRGEKIDPSTDFKGAVCNRSEFSVCTLPPLTPPNDAFKKREFSNNEKARILSKELHSYKTAKELQTLKNISVYTRPEGEITNKPLVVQKRRQPNNRQSMLSKFGKRISTIGDIFDKKSSREYSILNVSSEKSRSISLGAPHPGNSYHPESKETDSIVDLIDMNLELNGNKTNELSTSNKEKEVLDISLEPLSLVDSHSEQDLVYTKNNQLYINFPNDSQSSLVSELLETYSKLHEKETDISIKSPQLRNSQVFNFKAPVHSFTPSYRNSAGTSISTSVATDLFSTAPTSCYTESSESLHDITHTGINRDVPVRIRLSTTNYQKKLPSIPLREIDQFCIRNYSDTSQNAIILDKEIPPKTPTHFSSPTKSPISPETTYYDCEDSFSKFSFLKPTENAAIDCGNCFEEKDSKTKTQSGSASDILLDTKVFTRQNTRKNDRKSSQNEAKPRLAEIRTTSEQYLKNAGISPFMLTGYQENKSLKVMNL